MGFVDAFHIERVARQLDERFERHIDMSDLSSRPDSARVPAFRSRALAAMVVGKILACDDETAAGFVIDGFDDQGIDAVGVDVGAGRLVIVQAKWSEQGKGTLTEEASLKMMKGFRKIIDGHYDAFNRRFQSLRTDVDNVLHAGTLRVDLVAAILGGGPASAGAREPFDDMRATFGHDHHRVDVRIYHLDELHEIASTGELPSVDLPVMLQGCSTVNGPMQAYYGTVSVQELSNWYEQYSDHLFAGNIRQYLGTTTVNGRLLETLAERPDDFWYFNNGITIICDEIESHAFGSFQPGSPRTFTLRGASIVNGAQTVAAAHLAVQRDESAGVGQVLARLIKVDQTAGSFAAQITRATNTQNRIQPRDFAALGPEQHLLRRDFRVHVRKTYTVKRGEGVPPLDEGCTVEEAAEALVCALKDPTIAVRARENEDLLWEESKRGGFYDQIFPANLRAEHVWRWVLLRRVIRTALEGQRRNLGSAALRVVDFGEPVLIHIVMRRLGARLVRDRFCDWNQEVLAKAEAEVTAVIPEVITAARLIWGENCFLRTAVERPDRVAELVAKVLKGVVVDSEELTAGGLYAKVKRTRKTRRPDAVAYLVGRDVVEEGTPLEFLPKTADQRAHMRAWLNEDPSRAEAIWTNNRATPIVWAYDQVAYSPSNLVMRMLIMSGMPNVPKAVQGPVYWFLREHGSLTAYAERLQDERDGEEELDLPEVETT